MSFKINFADSWLLQRALSNRHQVSSLRDKDVDSLPRDSDGDLIVSLEGRDCVWHGYIRRPWVRHDRLYSWKMKMKRSKKTEDQPSLSYSTSRSMNRSSIPEFYQAKALRRVDMTPREEGEKIMMLDTNSDTRGIIIVFFFFFSCIHIELFSASVE